MTLELINNLTKSVQTFTGLTDNSVSRMFYNFNITLPHIMDEGEYSYKLYDGEVLKAEGLAQIGDYTPINTAYTANNEYKQYNG